MPIETTVISGEIDGVLKRSTGQFSLRDPLKENCLVGSCPGSPQAPAGRR